MTTTIASDRERIFFILSTYPDSKSERLLKEALETLPPTLLDETLEQLAEVIPQEVRDWTLENFDRLDSAPNPPDGYLSLDEIGEFILIAMNSYERGILLYLWLHFDEIRSSHEDFSGLDKAFDYVISKKDLLAFVWKMHCTAE
ncbi:MAG: hypothetical protein U0105_02295 [Candidatus Obscuribacterales bacterium]